ncbi:MAG: hypothetical protein GY746_00225, partial [Gammaproteobacteria bacterium]|nr:hypothetical protein [Gammaproteobacteria bacterium]
VNLSITSNFENWGNHGIYLPSTSANTVNYSGGLSNHGLFNDYGTTADLVINGVVSHDANSEFYVGKGDLIFLGDSTFDGLMSVDMASTLNFQTASYSFANPVVQSGGFSFNGGTYTGQLNLPATSTVDIDASSGNVVFDAFTLDTAGASSFSSSFNDLVMNNASTWTNNGLLLISNTSGSAGITNTVGSGSFVNGPAGFLQVNPAINIDFFVPVDNQGQIEVQTGIMEINNPSTSSGSIDVLAGATFLIGSGTSSSLTLSGTPLIGGSGTFSVDGNTVFDVAVPVAMDPLLTLTLTSTGVIDNAENLTIPDTFNWSGGTIRGTAGQSFTTPAGSVV